MQDVDGRYLKGHFLMAMPGLLDPNFAQTVTCISEHNADGAFGLVVNRVHGLLIAKDIFGELGIRCTPEAASLPIYNGGPVHTGEVFILHGPPFHWEGTLPITESLALSNTMDLLKAIGSGSGPGSVMICLGCAGWAPGQLEAEIRQNAWLTGTVSDDILFEVPWEQRWEEAVKRIGVHPELLTGISGNA